MQEIESRQDGESKQFLKALAAPLSEEGTSAIEIVGLNKMYRGAGGCFITAVEDLTLSVLAGQIFGFLLLRSSMVIKYREENKPKGGAERCPSR